MSDQEPTGTRHEIPRTPGFSIPVVIEGLQYIFKGDLPDKPTDFRFTVDVPDWQKYVNATKASGKLLSMDTYTREMLEKDGTIGYIFLDSVGQDSETDICLSYIRSSTGYMPSDSPYFNARGIGGFLMNNLLAFLDFRGWSIAAVPRPDGGGRLDTTDIADWNTKKGFVFGGNGEMVRLPQQPDNTQAVMQVLNPVGVK